MELVKSESIKRIRRKRKTEVSSKEDEVENEIIDLPTKMTPEDGIAQMESFFYIPQDFSTQVHFELNDFFILNSYWTLIIVTKNITYKIRYSISCQHCSAG